MTQIKYLQFLMIHEDFSQKYNRSINIIQKSIISNDDFQGWQIISTWNIEVTQSYILF